MKILVLIFSITILILSSCDLPSQSKTKKLSSLDEINLQIEENPNQADLYQKRANIYIKSSSFDRAIADLNKAANLEPDSIVYYMQLADLFLQSGQIKNTMGVLKKVTKIDPNYPDAWLKLGEINLMFKKYQDVFDHANKALEADPYNDKAYFLKAYAFKEMKDTNNAINNFQECLKFNPQHYDANIELGIMFMSLKNELAVSYFNNAIAIDTSKVDAYYNLGLYYQNSDQLNEAIAVYKQLGEVNPSFPSSYYNIGYIYLEMLNISDMSIPYFTKAINANQQYFEAYYNRGLAYEKLGDVHNAQNDYKQALNINHNYVKARNALNRVEKNMSK